MTTVLDVRALARTLASRCEVSTSVRHPPSEHDIDLAEAELGVVFPTAYREFLRVLGTLSARGRSGRVMAFGVADEALPVELQVARQAQHDGRAPLLVKADGSLLAVDAAGALAWLSPHAPPRAETRDFLSCVRAALNELDRMSMPSMDSAARSVAA